MADDKNKKALESLSKEAAQTGAELNEAFKSLGETIKQSVNNNVRGANQIMKDILDQTKLLGGLTKNVGKNIEALNKGLLTTEDIEERLEAVELKRAQIETELLKISRKRNKPLNDALTTLNKINEEAQKQKNELERQLRIGKLIEEQRANQAKIQEIVNKKMGTYASVMAGVSKIPIVGRLIDSERVLAKMKKTAEETGSRLKTAFAGLSETVKSIGDTLTSPAFLVGGLIGLLKAAYKLATEYQQKQFDAARDLGLQVDQAKKLRDHFVNMSMSNAHLGLLADDLQKAYAAVQDQMGIIVKQSDEFNVTTALIMRRTGATAEHMTTLQYAALKTGKSLQGAYQSIIGAAKATAAKLKLDMSEKQILDGISKVSATVLSNFKGNYAQLVKSVVEAKKLGITLDQINGTSDQFLDFESSITKQFEAQALTGEELDLTRARQLAESRDTAGLMKEMNRLIGDRAKWDKLGLLAQQSKAEALGLQRDVLNQMFVDQEKTNLLGKAAGEDLKTQYDYLVANHATQKQIEDTLGAQAVQSIQQSSTAEKMAVLMEGIKNTIAQMLQQFLPLVEKAILWLSKTENLKSVFITISKIIGGIVGLSLTLKGISAARAMIEQAQLQSLVRQNAVITAQIAKEAALTTEKSVGAAASIGAGSSYMGPAAIGVISTVLAILGAAAGVAFGGSAAESAMSGMGDMGGGGASDLSGVSVPTAVATPSTSELGNTIGKVAAASKTGGGTKPIHVTTNVVMDRQVVGTATARALPSEHSTYLDNNTGYS